MISFSKLHRGDGGGNGGGGVVIGDDGEYHQGCQMEGEEGGIREGGEM